MTRSNDKINSKNEKAEREKKGFRSKQDKMIIEIHAIRPQVFSHIYYFEEDYGR